MSAPPRGFLDVRAASPADSAAIAALLGQLGYPTAAESMPDRIADIEREGGVVVVACDDSRQIVGLASASRVSTLHAGGHVGYITSLVTAEAARGHGVGRALVSAIEAWARRCGCARLSVTSGLHRDDAHAFYPRCGMPYSGRRFSRQLDVTAT